MMLRMTPKPVLLKLVYEPPVLNANKRKTTDNDDPVTKKSKFRTGESLWARRKNQVQKNKMQFAAKIKHYMAKFDLHEGLIRNFDIQSNYPGCNPYNHDEVNVERILRFFNRIASKFHGTQFARQNGIKNVYGRLCCAYSVTTTFPPHSIHKKNKCILYVEL